jgi:hypothetical protein
MEIEKWERRKRRERGDRGQADVATSECMLSTSLAFFTF